VEFSIVKFEFFRTLVALALSFCLTLGYANNVFAQPITPSSQLLAANIFKGAPEKIEGKVRQTVGNFTGDRELQIEGKVKQAEGNIRASDPSNPSEAEIEGKTQQAESNIRRYQTPDHKSTDLKNALQ
jgi:uncharacterized protein YjbJ (UPF0337 family)